ncbi:MAG: PEP-CTERM sorting domain-containing protein [Acidobacteria bacterium]|nr:PEP-CTERM sorting domain-containing protein [Acidobacteriota bacterium]
MMVTWRQAMSGFVRVVVAGAVWVSGVCGAGADPLTVSQATSTHLVGLNEWTRDGGHVVGQIFTAPDAVHTVLTSFSFRFATTRAGLDYEALVYEYSSSTNTSDGPTLPGSALFSSGPRNTGADGKAAPPSFSGLSVNLDPLKRYVAFLSTAGLNSGPDVFATLGGTNTNPYAGGWMFSPYTTNSLQQLLTSNSASNSGGDWDLEFTMTFAAPAAASIPEPATSVLLAAGVLTGVVRRRKRSIGGSALAKAL